MSAQDMAAIEALPGVPACRLGESPVWHPEQGALWWCDIPGKAIHRWIAASGEHRSWTFGTEPACLVPLPGGRWWVAMRDGLWHWDPGSGERSALAEPPYDPAHERFNDGKADPQGRLWVGTIYEPRNPASAALYRYSAGRLERQAGDVTVSNGLAFSPDGRTMYWSDTQAHTVYRLPFDGQAGTAGTREVFARFAPKVAGVPLDGYGGRPDGAAVDVEGCYWTAMFEGQRLLRLSPQGEILSEVRLPVRCPTMPCFGGANLRTLFVTTARENRPAEELAAQPLAGCVLRLRVDVPGLPVNFGTP